ncbi:unnamed protein product [Chironomus riparius]|uniref:Uncharacterized protein n=1 Tax=Chironomus riparius TaxID=315576 RepID=A0A9N9RLR9_9DIPT|nr:unnamed protein product [Chironomus riparius]
MALLRACAVLVIYSTFILFTSAKSIEMTGNEFFLSVDSSRRDSLVKHFLTDALQRHQVYVSPDPRVANPIAEFGIPPQNFANNLLYWTRATLELDYTQIAAAIANNNVNTDELGCNHDIGCHCCPF